MTRQWVEVFNSSRPYPKVDIVPSPSNWKRGGPRSKKNNEVTSREFFNIQWIRKVYDQYRAYIQAYNVLEITDELDCQSGGIMGSINVIELAAGGIGVVTLQEIGAVMKLLKYHHTTL